MGTGYHGMTWKAFIHVARSGSPSGPLHQNCDDDEEQDKNEDEDEYEVENNDHDHVHDDHDNDHDDDHDHDLYAKQATPANEILFLVQGLCVGDHAGIVISSKNMSWAVSILYR